MTISTSSNTGQFCPQRSSYTSPSGWGIRFTVCCILHIVFTLCMYIYAKCTKKESIYRQHTDKTCQRNPSVQKATNVSIRFLQTCVCLDTSDVERHVKELKAQFFPILPLKVSLVPAGLSQRITMFYHCLRRQNIGKAIWNLWCCVCVLFTKPQIKMEQQGFCNKDEWANAGSLHRSANARCFVATLRMAGLPGWV